MEELRVSQRVRQRTSSACDACRVRKVKCVVRGDEAKCSMCIELNIGCTNVRPRKKRGPKNRYVQKLCAQLDGNDLEPSVHERHDLGLIASLDTIRQIIEDWFGWIHPVAPIFQREFFEEQVMGPGSQSNVPASFLLLMASICAATVASLRRRRHIYGTVTVESCLELAERFKLWSFSSSITLERALTLYNFSTAVHHEHGIDSPLAFRLSGEAAASTQYLMHQKLDQLSFAEQQILKRVYWLIFAGQCTAELHGRRMLSMHHAHEPSNPLFPMAISDQQLAQGLDSEPISTTEPDYSYIPGLIALSRLFLAWQSSQATSVQTLDNLQQHIMRTQNLLEELPLELTWTDRRGEAGSFGFNVQKVNLKVTQLHIRANLLEQMNTLANIQGFRVTPDAIIHERHLVVEELLEVLYAMPEEVFDANGFSVVPKIRDIGSALFDELRTGSHGRTLQASINLDKLLAKLENLDLWTGPRASYL